VIVISNIALMGIVFVASMQSLTGVHHGSISSRFLIGKQVGADGIIFRCRG
jgi:hypothetical protein